LRAIAAATPPKPAPTIVTETGRDMTRELTDALRAGAPHRRPRQLVVNEPRATPGA
jgi:hypothetical protein